MAESLRPFVEMQEHIKARTVQPSWLAGYENAARQIVEFDEAMKRALAPIAVPLVEFGKKLAVLERQSRLLDKAGWLPHVTTPVNLIANNR